jgi:hypothetical protein
MAAQYGILTIDEPAYMGSSVVNHQKASDTTDLQQTIKRQTDVFSVFRGLGSRSNRTSSKMPKRMRGTIYTDKLLYVLVKLVRFVSNHAQQPNGKYCALRSSEVLL